MLTAFLLGAGLGTRLRPLTEHLPKPLVPVVNKPLVTYALDHLRAAGWKRFLINTHYCPAAWRTVFGGDDHTAEYRGCPVHFRHEPTLLETGGGLKNMEDLAGKDDLLLYNADTLQHLDVKALLQRHREEGNVATLALRSHGGPLAVRCDLASGRVLDIGGRLGVNHGPSFLFTGVYVVSPEIYRWIPAGTPISIIPVFLQLIQAGRRVAGVLMDEGPWRDLGEPAAYLEAHQWLYREGLAQALPSAEAQPWQKTLPPPEVQAKGFLCVGEGVSFGGEAVLEDCILWNGAIVAPGAQLTRCVVRSGQTAQGVAQDDIF